MMFNASKLPEHHDPPPSLHFTIVSALALDLGTYDLLPGRLIAIELPMYLQHEWPKLNPVEVKDPLDTMHTQYVHPPAHGLVLYAIYDTLKHVHDDIADPRAPGQCAEGILTDRFANIHQK